MGTRNDYYLNALHPVPRKSRAYSFGGLAGCVCRQRCRATGTTTGVYRADQTDIDAEQPWMASCETHGTMLGCDRLDLAKESAKDPSGWCEGCRAAKASNQCSAM